MATPIRLTRHVAATIFHSHPRSRNSSFQTSWVARLPDSGRSVVLRTGRLVLDPEHLGAVELRARQRGLLAIGGRQKHTVRSRHRSRSTTRRGDAAAPAGGVGQSAAKAAAPTPPLSRSRRSAPGAATGWARPVRPWSDACARASRSRVASHGMSSAFEQSLHQRQIGMAVIQVPLLSHHFALGDRPGCRGRRSWPEVAGSRSASRFAPAPAGAFARTARAERSADPASSWFRSRIGAGRTPAAIPGRTGTAVCSPISSVCSCRLRCSCLISRVSSTLATARSCVAADVIRSSFCGAPLRREPQSVQRRFEHHAGLTVVIRARLVVVPVRLQVNRRHRGCSGSVHFQLSLPELAPLDGDLGALIDGPFDQVGRIAAARAVRRAPAASVLTATCVNPTRSSRVPSHSLIARSS